MTRVAPEHPRRLVYLGTPAMAVPPLQALVAAGFEVALAPWGGWGLPTGAIEKN